MNGLVSLKLIPVFRFGVVLLANAAVVTAIYTLYNVKNMKY